MTGNDNTISGINNNGIDDLIRELALKNTTICEKISQLKTVYSTINEYCSGTTIISDDFLNNFDKTKETVEFNIDSYSKDFRELQTRFNENDKILSTLIFEHAESFNSKAENIDNKTFFEENRK
jgi:hypothetical protein